MRNYFFMLTCVAALFSCHSKPVTVNIDLAVEDSTETHLLIFDGKDSVHLADSMVNVQLTPGKHSLVLDKKPAREFTVGPKGGLLNLSNRQFVAFDVEYKDKDLQQNKINIPIRRLKAAVLIDSFVVMTKGVPFPGRGNKDPLVMLEKLLHAKNGNYMQGSDEYDHTTNVAGIKQFGKDQLFIDKFWDYDMNEEMPENIQVEVNSNAMFTSGTYKTTYLPSRLFLLATQLSPEDYTVQPVADIRLGKTVEADTITEEDRDDDSTQTIKPQQKSKAKHQLKF